MTIHWCGTGLSSIPGLRRLIEAGPSGRGLEPHGRQGRAEVGDVTQGHPRLFSWRR
jgi:hypothetical protein